jgi:hypothetical protein
MNFVTISPLTGGCSLTRVGMSDRLSALQQRLLAFSLHRQEARDPGHAVASLALGRWRRLPKPATGGWSLVEAGHVL